MRVIGPVPSATVTVLVAAAGYGKSTVVGHWAGTLRRQPVDLAETGDLPDERILYVIEDLPAGSRIGDAVIERAAGWTSARLVLTSRSRVRVPARWRGRGVVGELGPVHLAVPSDQAGRLLTDRYGADAGMGEQVSGWPALLHLAGAAAAAGADPSSAVTEYLIAEVLTPLSGPVRRALRVAAHLPAVDTLPPAVVDYLTAIGLIRGAALVPAVAAAIRAWQPLPEPVRRTTLLDASARYATAGHPRRALRCLLDVEAGPRAGQGDSTTPTEQDRAPGPDDVTERVNRLVQEHGRTLIAAGHAGLIVEALRNRPGDRLMYGEALQVIGDSDAASTVYRELAGPAGPLPAALAWRAGVVDYLRGRPQAAGDYFDRGVRVADRDTAILLGWTAAARWMLGDATGCGRLAAEALALAGALADATALATAHIATALSCTLTGDRAGRQRHYDCALRYAEAAGDVVQVTRVRANRAGSLCQEGRYAEALLEVRPAVQLADRSDYAAMLALALCNQGEIHLRLGYLDEAEADYARAAALYRRMGSRKVAYPLTGQATLHRLRGRPGMARAAYEEAIRIAGRDADLQGLVPALAGLARVAGPDDPVAADAAARRALAESHTDGEPGPYAAIACLAAGTVALAAGDPSRVAELARTAAEHARRHSDVAALAEALELLGHAARTPVEARRAFSEAQRTWREAGASLDVDRLAALLGQLPGADPGARGEGRVAAGRLAALGVTAIHWAGGGSRGSVALRTLGQFEVVVDGAPVPVAAWQSRKARDLLRILVARRGRAIPRDELAELLWPESTDRSKVAHRLTVALSILRGVLDPERRVDPDRYVRADTASVALDLAQVDVDVEAFLAAAEEGLRLVAAATDDPAGLHLLADADRAYPGDFLADEPYDEWSVPLRDYARSLFIQVERALAGAAERRRDVDGAVRALLRLLEADPYDAAAHEAHVSLLTRVGRHGEAGRAFHRYVAAMSALGLPADGVSRPPGAAQKILSGDVEILRARSRWG
ncbi:tetratricopeptide repeat protein [Plantactinospora sp. GCM10030261]|uniref:tetratricopeptide repeat protein n=1 Tax=Plantactinospora sp. GCM10030261 TaxID=3273420 RepID=UPI0036171159